MKKAIAVLLCLAMLCGLGVTAFAQTEDEVITGEFRFTPTLAMILSVDSSFRFAYSDSFFSHSGYEYDHDLAKMTMALCCAGSASGAKTDWSEGNRNFIDLVQKCGFTNIDANYYTTHAPTPDSIGVSMASKAIGDCTLLAVGVRGHGYDREWCSDFTLGTEGDHQGFAEARDQVLDYMKEYIAQYNVTGRIKVWITGYSRGAAAANMVGGAIDRGFDFGNGTEFDLNDLYCYTFEAPQGTADPNCRDAVYGNIHNIINANDIVPLVSLSEWGHSRFGVDYVLPCRQNDGSYYYELKDEANKLLSKMDYINIAGIPLNFIDDFHYITLDRMKAMQKQNVTQIEFFDELVDVLTATLAPSREYVCENLQNDLREIFIMLYGLMENAPEVLTSFGQSFVQIENLQALYSLLVNGGADAMSAAVDQIGDLFMRSMQQHGAATYGGAEVRAMVDKLAKGLLELFKAAPDTVMTLLGNLLPILNAHFPEVGMTFLDVTPEAFFLAQSPAFFTDVSRNAYYYNAVKWAYLKGITVGFDFSTFAPDDVCTRAQVVTYLYRAAGSPAVSGECPFVDVKTDSPYYNAIVWAAQKGIAAGYDATHFRPDQSCSRAQIVTFLYRYMGSPDMLPITPFADVPPTSPYASAVAWASCAGITKGTDITHFDPDAVCTRAQTVTFLYRCLG